MVIMLTDNQFCVLFPPYEKDISKIRSSNRCLFGSPDREETRRLFEEHIAADRQLMIRKYGFDNLTCRTVTNICSFENEEAVTASEDNFLVPDSTNEEVEKRHCSPESKVRRRSERYAPYNRQTKITGKKQ
jgi:hypothetical protein